MLVPAIGFFLVFLLVLGCGGFAAAYLRTQENRRLRSMLATTEHTLMERRTVNFLRPSPAEGHLLRWLAATDLSRRMASVLAQAGIGWTPSRWIVISVAIAAGAFFVAWQAPPFMRPYLLVFLPAFGASVPSLYVFRKRRGRLEKFVEQFPEALDFLARSLRAGHALSIGLEMLGSESPEPLGSILRLVVNDLRLGSSQESALGRLSTLVPLLDVQFFIAALLLQQETGGNLSEILLKLSHIIRERFRLQGQVRAISAHGRITAGVLIVMPFTVAVLMFLISPAYLMTLFTDHRGRSMLIGALIAQAVGVLVVRRIIAIKV